MNQELYDRLRTAGVADAEAEEISKSFGTEATEETVDVDRLTKAMQDVATSFESDTSAVDAAVQEASDIVDAVTKGADALLVEQRTQYEALAKGILALADEVRDLRGHMSSNTEEITKSLTAVADEPVERKSIVSDVEIIAAPGEVTTSGPLGYNELIAKALNELQATDDNHRQNDLRKAVSLLESGTPAATIQSQYGL